MKRGDLYRVKHPTATDPRRQRASVVVSRQALIDSSFSTVVCAPVYSPPEMSAFSDRYVISERAQSGWQVLATVQALAAFLLYKGIHTRGGIVKGDV